MGGLGQSILEEGREEGREKGRKEGREEGREKGRKEGREEGAFQILSSLVADGRLKLEEAARRMDLSEEAFRERMKAQEA